MEKVENIVEFYQRKLDRIPEDIHNEIGHLNVFRLEPFVGDKAKPVPYKRRGYSKITLMVGNSKIHYADKVIEIQKQALVFSNPQIPYMWEHMKVSGAAFSVFLISLSSINMVI